MVDNKQEDMDQVSGHSGQCYSRTYLKGNPTGKVVGDTNHILGGSRTGSDDRLDVVVVAEGGGERRQRAMGDRFRVVDEDERELEVQ